MMNKVHLILMWLLAIGPLLVYTQIQPTNAHEYNIDVRFHRSFGTIGSDGAGNDPDPTWQIAVANDTNSTEGNEIVNRFDLLDNTPNVLNPNAYCLLLIAGGPLLALMDGTIPSMNLSKFLEEIRQVPAVYRQTVIRRCMG